MSYRESAKVEEYEVPEPRDWLTIAARLWLVSAWFATLVGGTIAAVFVDPGWAALVAVTAFGTTIAAIFRLTMAWP